MRYQSQVDNLIVLLTGRGITDQRVLSAIAAIPREFFVDEAFSYQAYENNALPIGSGQTISMDRNLKDFYPSRKDQDKTLF